MLLNRSAAGFKAAPDAQDRLILRVIHRLTRKRSLNNITLAQGMPGMPMLTARVLGTTADSRFWDSGFNWMRHAGSAGLFHMLQPQWPEYPHAALYEQAGSQQRAWMLVAFADQTAALQHLETVPPGTRALLDMVALLAVSDCGAVTL